MKQRVAIYARTSTNRQDIEMQLDDLRRHVEMRRWELSGEFVDEGVSSRRDKRPEMEKLMTLARRRSIDQVVVWRFDRFARSTRELVTALDEFRTLGVHFTSLQEAIDTSTPAGRVVFAVIAAVAEFEREIIRERVKAGVAKAKRNGKKLGRPRRYVDIQRARKLREEGHSWSTISKCLHIPASTIRLHLKQCSFPNKST